VRDRVDAQIQLFFTDPSNIWFFIRSGDNYYLFDVIPVRSPNNEEVWNYDVSGIPIGGPGDTGIYQILVIYIDGAAKESFLPNKGLWLQPGGQPQLPIGANEQKQRLPVLRVC
jgi:hypothetical protein